MQETVLDVMSKGRVWDRLRRACRDGHVWELGRLSWPFQSRHCPRCGRVESVKYEDEGS